MTKKILLVGGFVIIVAVLLFSGRFLGNNDQITTSSSHAGAASVVSAPEKNIKAAPPFSLSSLEGKTLSLEDYRGQKPVVLDFFATWCPNCRRDMPNLNRFYEKYKDKIEVIGVNLQESPSVVKKFIDEQNISFPIVLDPLGTVSRNYGTRYTNTHVLINTDGTIARTISGDIREQDIVTLIGTN
ncbi:MAG: redoxin domain-containing protein [Parcubacteria group bacterium]|nr:redoxin domain-containing protein [Parcubacteria group bacterium]